PEFTLNTDIMRLWGASSPYFSAGMYTSPPAGCRVDQVNVLQCHDAHFPTSGAATTIISGINKLQSVHNFTDPRLDFLKNFAYALGVVDLVPFGAHQSFEAGEDAYSRYRNLLRPENLPFLRASSSARVINSATNWTAGHMPMCACLSPHRAPLTVLQGNDTLDDSMCANAGNSDAQTDALLAVFAPPITACLNRWAPGANVTDAETYSLSAPSTPSHQQQTLLLSPFCALFNADEFAAFEYSMDLDKYYGTGYGAYLGRVQGMGYINELLARLTHTPVNDSMQTNRTLDASPATFPLDRVLYADFSHNNQMTAIYAAMGLFLQAAPLNPTAAPAHMGMWVASRLVPFSAHMVVERLACACGAQYVRVLVNDAAQPLAFCADQKTPGVCELGAFVRSQAYARGGGDGDWATCFA
ncbi:phytase, partial [Mycena rosella]